MPSVIADYLTTIRLLIERLGERATPSLEQAAELAADSLARDEPLHVFGSGHSMLATIEATVRAGGLAAVDLLFDPALSPTDPDRVSATERLHGYAAATLDVADLRPGEVLVVVSNSGINPVPIEMATGAHDRGLQVVAITSEPHANATPSRHQSGRRLHDVADVVIDTGAPVGDTTMTVAGHRTGAVSTILACAALHAMTIRAIELLAEDGHDVSVLASQNRVGNDDRNREMLRVHRQHRRKPQA